MAYRRDIVVGELEFVKAPRQQDCSPADKCISLISIGYSCGVFVLMYIESITTGNGIPHGRDLWSKADVQRRRHDYTTMENWDQALLSPTYIKYPLFPRDKKNVGE